MDEQGYQERIAVLERGRDELEKEIDTLEETIRGLEAEGLLPLVDRLRTQVATMKKLVTAMAEAIDELLEKPK